MTRSYNLEDVYLTVNSVLITEYADGDAITIEYDEDDTVENQGTHGSVMVAERPNNIASLTFTVKQGSPVNGFLWNLRRQKRGQVAFSFPIMCNDNRGEALISAAQAWIKKPPSLAYGTEPGDREWTMKISTPDIRDGENLLA